MISLTKKNIELEDLRSENNRQLLEGKLFNATEEISHNDMKETKNLKNMVSGGRMRVKLMWHQPYFIKNRAKLMKPVAPDIVGKDGGSKE